MKKKISKLITSALFLLFAIILFMTIGCGATNSITSIVNDDLIIKGRVFDATGEPIVGINIVATTYMEGTEDKLRASAISGSDGRFNLTFKYVDIIQDILFFKGFEDITYTIMIYTEAPVTLKAYKDIILNVATKLFEDNELIFIIR